MRHPSTHTWKFAAPIATAYERVNLKELVARPDRHEHHLIVAATIDGVQLEIVTASEPLYFAHVNGSDEWVVPLATGDPMIDGFPMRTFVADATTNTDVARYNHRCGDLLLHPVGYLHWPGRLRPPYAPMEMAPGMRRCGVTLVYCATDPTPVREARGALRVEGDAKAYADPAPPLAVIPLAKTAPGVLAAIGSTTLALATGTITAPRGAWVVDLASTDLIRVPPGGSIELARALVVTSDRAEPDPAPAAWTELPEPPFAPFDEATRGELPISHGALTITADGVTLDGTTAAVPRYWLARMLFRVALHGMRLGYVETYEGFYVDDGQGGPEIRIGLRGGGSITVPRSEARALIERMYRAIAPPGYFEL